MCTLPAAPPPTGSIHTPCHFPFLFSLSQPLPKVYVPLKEKYIKSTHPSDRFHTVQFCEIIYKLILKNTHKTNTLHAMQSRETIGKDIPKDSHEMNKFNESTRNKTSMFYMLAIYQYESIIVYSFYFSSYYGFTVCLLFFTSNGETSLRQPHHPPFPCFHRSATIFRPKR